MLSDSDKNRVLSAGRRLVSSSLIADTTDEKVTLSLMASLLTLGVSLEDNVFMKRIITAVDRLGKNI